jgi:hypothetical protein
MDKKIDTSTTGVRWFRVRPISTGQTGSASAPSSGPGAKVIKLFKAVIYDFL